MGASAAVAWRETGLTGGAHELARGRARVGGSALTRWSHRADRKGRSECARATGFGTDRRNPPGREKTRAHAWVGWAEWAERPARGRLGFFVFFFYSEFSNPFFFYFFFGFKFKHATNLNLNIPNMCIKQKNNLGSA
jgi:hypothetical protein